MVYERRDNHFRKGTIIKIRHEVMPFIGIIAAIGVCIGFLLNAFMPSVAFILGGTAFLLFFFRDPDRTPPLNPVLVLSGAAGRVMDNRSIFIPSMIKLTIPSDPLFRTSLGGLIFE